MMRIIERYISRISVLLYACALLPVFSCSSSSESGLSELEPKCMLELYVDMGGKDILTSRANAPTGPGYETGAGFENFIDRNDLLVFLFSTDNKLIAPIYGYTLERDYDFSLTNSGNFGIYRMRFRVDEILEDVYKEPQSFKILMFANWQRQYPPIDELIPGETTIEDITTHLTAVGTFKTDASAEGGTTVLPLGEENLIPFYGVQQYDNVVFTPGSKNVQEECLMLLRAFAKIDVCDDKETLKNIKSVTLKRYNTQYYKAPLGIYHNNDYTDYDYATDFVSNPSLPADDPYKWETADEIVLIKDADGHFVGYLPEYRNIGRADADRSRLIVTYDDGNDFTIDFKYYNDPPAGTNIGDPYDIRRNNWYKFVVKRNQSEITFIVDVIPFSSIELKPDYGLEREDITGYVVGKDKAGRPCWFAGNYYDPATATPLYLGPKDKPGEAVPINGKEYMLVYADYGRTPATLDHVLDKATGKTYFLYPAGRTGYKLVIDKNGGWQYYLNARQHRVWLDETVRLKFCRTLNEWDRREYSIVVDKWAGYDHDSYNPIYWFDILGNRYAWKDGDTKEKRAAILGEWVTYLRAEDE